MYTLVSLPLTVSVIRGEHFDLRWTSILGWLMTVLTITCWSWIIVTAVRDRLRSRHR
ncbi:hypothetical protein GPX89_05790 [Nocardia sp. ET3-3]|uniref:Uncharacterized protein n=1 Tax=Nocardia terrae TaxID=2675851 RepID=A0A7K1US76_9NOCA|nr:hypothetical protein [Nocardia terrae]MVU76758.1 hypothetical protein [Nocardia terrae]